MVLITGNFMNQGFKLVFFVSLNLIEQLATFERSKSRQVVHLSQFPGIRKFLSIHQDENSVAVFTGQSLKFRLHDAAVATPAGRELHDHFVMLCYQLLQGIFGQFQHLNYWIDSLLLLRWSPAWLLFLPPSWQDILRQISLRATVRRRFSNTRRCFFPMESHSLIRDVQFLLCRSGTCLYRR